MYVPYDKIFDTLALFTPIELGAKLKNFGMKLKTKNNLKYISKNKKQVIKKLKEKIKNNEKINVVFYIYDETKWKSQSIYNLLEEDERFTPYIFVSKNCSTEDNMNFQTKNDITKVYDFFKNKNMRVLYAYDFENDNYIPLDEMKVKPDIVFYSHPWYIYKTQGPVMVSKYAITCYIPYFIATSISPIEYYTRFHQYVENHYVLNDLIKNYYAENMDNKGENLKSTGHPMLDYFYLNKNKTFENKNYTIYAPHWSVDKNNNLHWGTFLDLGYKILNYAKTHPNLNWIYKPHPCLESYLIKNSYYTKEEINSYRKEWQNIGQIMETGDYLDLFMQSKTLITDCGSFETEYFLTQKPLIHLKSNIEPTPFNPSVKKIINSCYEAHDFESLKEILDEVIIKNNDYKIQERKKVYKELGYENNYAAENILEDILNCLK